MRAPRRLAIALCLLIASLPAIPVRASYLQTNLVADEPGVAATTDATLVNPWGAALPPTGGNLWVSVEASAKDTVYNGAVGGGAFNTNSLVVSVPSGGHPTGMVFNPSATDFLVTDGTNSGPAAFLMSSTTGAITGWSPAVPPPAPSTAAQPAVLTSGAVYTGIAISTDAGGSRLYAADTANNRVDVFGSNFAPLNLGGTAFQVPALPANLHVFNIQNLGGTLYATYVNSADEADGGAVAAFDRDGTLLRVVTQGSPLAAPWGVAIAPAGFGPFSGALLVGNNEEDYQINAFNPTTGQFLGSLLDSGGNQIELDGLWALQFGNGVTTGDSNTLFFTAGEDDVHGLLGKIEFAIPEPASLSLATVVIGAAALRRRRG